VEINFRKEQFSLPISRAMRLTGTPAWCLSQISSFSASVNLCTATPPDRRHQRPPIRAGVALTA
jgi:hypothetical protein